MSVLGGKSSADEAKDYKFEKENYLGVWSQKKVSLSDLFSPLIISVWGQRFKATLATTSI